MEQRLRTRREVRIYAPTWTIEFQRTAKTFPDTPISGMGLPGTLWKLLEDMPHWNDGVNQEDTRAPAMRAWGRHCKAGNKDHRAASDQGHRGDVVRKDNDPHGSHSGLTSNFYFILRTFHIHISHQRMCFFRPKQKKNPRRITVFKNTYINIQLLQ